MMDVLMTRMVVMTVTVVAMVVVMIARMTVVGRLDERGWRWVAGVGDGVAVVM
jgi:hypothetical protein